MFATATLPTAQQDIIEQLKLMDADLHPVRLLADTDLHPSNDVRQRANCRAAAARVLTGRVLATLEARRGAAMDAAADLGDDDSLRASVATGMVLNAARAAALLLDSDDDAVSAVGAAVLISAVDLIYIVAELARGD